MGKTYKIICKEDFYCIDDKLCKKDTIYYAYDCGNEITSLIMNTPEMPGIDHHDKFLRAFFSCVWRVDTKKVKEHFYTEQEYRKLKLLQLNGTR